MSESAEDRHRRNHPVVPAVVLPDAPSSLVFGPVGLRFSRIILPAEPSRGLVPAYHFRIHLGEIDVGHINLRVGDTEHVMRCVGHVGFGIATEHQGHRYALAACRALAPFARTFREEVIITCDPTNQASRRTIELLGASFIDQVPVPPYDPHYAFGTREKLRFVWRL